MARFQKKPVVIEAFQFTGDNPDELNFFTSGYFRLVDPEDRVDDPDMVAEVWDKLHSTWVGVAVGQWIIRGVQGEFYPCDPTVFEASYESERDQLKSAVARVRAEAEAYACQPGVLEPCGAVAQVIRAALAGDDGKGEA